MSSPRRNWKEVCKLEGPFVPILLEMLTSPAWQEASWNCRRLLDFLEIENMQHNGHKNGQLAAPYTQLADYGIRRGSIHEAIEEAIRLGFLIRTVQGQYRGHPSYTQYRLTARPYWHNKVPCRPSHEWKKYRPLAPVVLNESKLSGTES